MGRGIILGKAINADGSVVKQGSVNLSYIRAFNDVNGTKISFTCQRKDFTGGLFALPFFWEHYSADTYARVAGNDFFKVEVYVMKHEGKGGETFPFPGLAITEPDGMHLLSTLKAGSSTFAGNGKDPTRVTLKMLKKAVKGDEFHGIPFTNLSTEQLAIVGTVVAQLPR